MDIKGGLRGGRSILVADLASDESRIMHKALGDEQGRSSGRYSDLCWGKIRTFGNELCRKSWPCSDMCGTKRPIMSTESLETVKHSFPYIRAELREFYSFNAYISSYEIISYLISNHK